MGRSRGGLTTKIHALVDAGGRLIRFKIIEGQAHDGRSADDMLETLQRGNSLLADRTYDSDGLHAQIAAKDAVAKLRLMPNRIKILPFDHQSYCKRNVFERFFNKLKHFRAITTRYDKRDDNYFASIMLAAIRIQLRTYESVTWSNRLDQDGYSERTGKACKRSMIRQCRQPQARSKAMPAERREASVSGFVSFEMMT